MPRYSLITSFLGQTKDRFHVYHEPLSLEQKLSMVTEIPGYTGVELVYPYEMGPKSDVADAAATRKLLTTHGLELSAVNCNVKGEPEFVSGGLTNPDKGIRDYALSFIKSAKDFAAELGAPRVTCCPLGDGFEFIFQHDYRAAWTRLIETFGAAAEYRSDIPLVIEYKPKETRRHCFLNRAADTLLLVKEIGVPTLGVTMDYGHSIYAGEHPAEALSMLHYSGHPYYIHVNDNDKTWDWDYFTGSHTLLEYIEFVYYLRRFNYTEFITSDTHPTRWDLKGMFEVNARLTQKIWDKLAKIGDETIAAKIEAPDYMDTWRFIEEEILSFR